MIVLELIIVLLAIFLGVRFGGIGIGSVGGLSVLALAVIGVKSGNIPFGIISIIVAVIAAILAMQIAGGLDYLVHQTEKLLRKSPKYTTTLTPIVIYFLIIFADTGNIPLVTLLAIAEVAKGQGIKPCRLLSTVVVFAQIAITAPPISAVMVYMSSVMKGHGISYIYLLSVVTPPTLLAVLVMPLLVTVLLNSELPDDPIYRKRPEEGLVELCSERQVEIKVGAKTPTWLFPLGVVCVVVYVIVDSPSLGLAAKPLMSTTNAILIIMLNIIMLTTIICRAETDSIPNSSTFRAGMSACICILGVAWLGDTFVSHNIDWVKDTIGSVTQGHPWPLTVTFFFTSALLYSQVATARALMPMALALNVSPLTVAASFAAVSGLFILPTYPTLVVTVQVDDIGTTRTGKFVSNHPFFILGTLGVVLAICFGFLLGSFML